MSAMHHSRQPEPMSTTVPLNNEAPSSNVQQPRIRYTKNGTAFVEDVEEELTVSIAPLVNQLPPFTPLLPSSGTLAPVHSYRGDPPSDVFNDQRLSNMDGNDETAQLDTSSGHVPKLLRPLEPLVPDAGSARVLPLTRRLSQAVRPSSSPASADTEGNPSTLGGDSIEDGREKSKRRPSSGNRTVLSATNGEDSGVRPLPDASFPSPLGPTPDATSAPNAHLSSDAPPSFSPMDVDKDDPPASEHYHGGGVGSSTRRSRNVNSQPGVDGISTDKSPSTSAARNSVCNLRRSERPAPSPSSYNKQSPIPSRKKRKRPPPSRTPRPRPRPPAATFHKPDLSDPTPRAITEHAFIRTTPLAMQSAPVRVAHVS